MSGKNSKACTQQLNFGADDAISIAIGTIVVVHAYDGIVAPKVHLHKRASTCGVVQIWICLGRVGSVKSFLAGGHKGIVGRT